MGHFQVVQNMCTRGPEKGVGAEKIFEEILPENFPNVLRTVSTQINNPQIRKHYENTRHIKIAQNQ